MCGRYTLLAEEADILRAFGLSESIQDYEPNYNIAPGQQILAIIHDGKKKRAGYLKWGLVPSWAKDEKVGYKMINARSETAHVKPSFRHLMARKRCLIVADSFYEWQKTDTHKQPKRIQPKERPLFAFAGLWDKWSLNGKNIFTCTILTKDSNQFMQPIHHRMPIILPEEMEDKWISPQEEQPGEMQAMLQSIEMEPLSAYNVSTRVNAVKNNDYECIEAISQ